MPSTSATAPSSSLPNRLSEQFIFENDKIGDVYSSSASSSSSIDSSSEIEETKEEEKQELEDTLHISPSIDNKNKDGNDDDDSTAITSKVTFSEQVTEHSAREIDEDVKQHHRPSRTAKLTALTTWDTEDNDDDEEDRNNMSSSASPMHSSKAFSHFRHSQQANNAGLFSKLNPCRHLSWSIVGSWKVRVSIVHLYEFVFNMKSRLWLLHLTLHLPLFNCLFKPHVLTHVAITSLSSS